MRLAHLTIIVHWIDDSWEIQKRVISFISFDPTHKGRNIANLILSQIASFGLAQKKFTFSQQCI